MRTRLEARPRGSFFLSITSPIPNPRFCQKVKSSDALQLLKELGAPDRCHVMSSDSDLDGREMDLSDAINEIRGCGAIASCLPGVLAYFEGESPHEQYICHRRQSPK